MSNQFFEQPILNSPYEYPRRHWELDENGQPTQNIIDKRCIAEFITPIPKPKKRKKQTAQKEMVFDEGAGPVRLDDIIADLRRGGLLESTLVMLKRSVI